MKKKASLGPAPDPPQDELILAAIIAGAESSGRPFTPTYGLNYNDITAYGVERVSGPCCAIGMGCLFAGYDCVVDHEPLCFFANQHRVSHAAAVGVSDGFENNVGCTEAAEDIQEFLDFDRTDPSVLDPDYVRGWAIGEAARAYAEDA